MDSYFEKYKGILDPFKKKLSDIGDNLKFQLDAGQTGSVAQRVAGSKPFDAAVKFQESPAGKASIGLEKLFVENPVNFGYDAASAVKDLTHYFTNPTNTDYQYNENPFQTLKDQAGRTLQTGSALLGAGSPGYVAANMALSGGADLAFNRDANKNPYTQFFDSSISSLPRSLSAAGAMRATDPLLKSAGLLSKNPFLNLAARSATNVGQGGVINASMGDKPFTEESVLVDALLPVAGDVLGKGLSKTASGIKKGLSDALNAFDMQAFDRKVQEASSKKLKIDDQLVEKARAYIRDGQGRFSKTAEEAKGAIVGYRDVPIKNYTGETTYAKLPVYADMSKKDFVKYLNSNSGSAAGLIAGAEPEYDEKGNITGFKYDPAKGAAGVAVMAAVQNPEVRSAADDILTKARNEIGVESVGTSIKSKLVKGWDTFYTDWVDRFHPIEKMAKFAETNSNSSLRPEFDPRIQIKRLLGAGGVAELRHKQDLQPIIDSLKGVIDPTDFDVYLKAKRDIELSGRNIKGSDATVAEERLKALASKYDITKIEGAAQKLYAYQAKGLQSLKDAGFISDESKQAIQDANKNYVPFQRVMDEVDNFLGLPSSKLQNPSQPLKKIKGSDRAIESPLDSIVKNTYRVEAAVSKNRVAQSIASLESQFPELVKSVKSSGDNTITVWQNGKKAFYQVDKDVSDAVKGINEEQMNTVIKILSAPASMLRQQATGSNIDFMIPNVVRDQFEAGLNAKYGYTPFVDYIKGFKNLLSYERTGQNDIVEGWIKNGGQIFYDQAAGTKSVKDQVLDANTKKRLTKKLYDLVVGGVQTIGKYSETPTRLGIYERALKATGNEMLAASQSREATLDFARRGAKMQQLNAVIPFLNASIQGFDKYARTIKSNPKKALLLGTIYGGMPALVTTAYNITNHPEEYAQVPDFVKDANFVLMTGGTDKDGNPSYISIPKAHGVEPIANATQQIVDYFAGSNPKSFSQFALQTLGSTLPVVGAGDNLSEIASNTIGENLPQAIKPAIQQVTNHDFYKNKPIIPPYMELSKKPVETQFNKSTPELYKKLGGVLGASPLRLQNFAETTSPMMKQATNLINIADATANDEPMDINKVPIIRRFTGSYSGFDNERPADTGTSMLDKIKALIAPTQQTQAASGDPSVIDPKVINMSKRYGYTAHLSNPGKGTPAQRQEVLSQAKQLVRDESIKESDKKSILDSMRLESRGLVTYVSDTGTLKALDIGAITGLPSGTDYEKAVKTKKLYGVVDNVLALYESGQINDTSYQVALKQLGIDRKSAKYYTVASQTKELKRAYIREIVSSVDPDNRIKELITMRKMVNGKKLLSDDLIDEYVSSGVLPKQIGTALKAIDDIRKNEIIAKRQKSLGSSSRKQLTPFRIKLATLRASSGVGGISDNPFKDFKLKMPSKLSGY